MKAQLVIVKLAIYTTPSNRPLYTGVAGETWYARGILAQRSHSDHTFAIIYDRWCSKYWPLGNRCHKAFHLKRVVGLSLHRLLICDGALNTSTTHPHIRRKRPDTDREKFHYISEDTIFSPITTTKGITLRENVVTRLVLMAAPFFKIDLIAIDRWSEKPNMNDVCIS